MARRALIVDDEAAIRRVLSAILRSRGWEVRTACDGREGLECLRSPWQPDLILLDWNMPVMDGEEFRRQQLADPALARIPTVLVSGVAGLSEQAAALNLRLLPKPFLPTDVAALLHAYGLGD